MTWLTRNTDLHCGGTSKVDKAISQLFKDVEKFYSTVDGLPQTSGEFRAISKRYEIIIKKVK